MLVCHAVALWPRASYAGVRHRASWSDRARGTAHAGRRRFGQGRGSEKGMGILTKTELLEQIRSGSLVFTPELDEFQMQAQAVDLRLGFNFLIARHWEFTQQGRVALPLDHLAGGAQHFDSIELEPGQVFDVLPGESLLVSTLATIPMPAPLVRHMYPRPAVNCPSLPACL